MPVWPHQRSGHHSAACGRSGVVGCDQGTSSRSLSQDHWRTRRQSDDAQFEGHWQTPPGHWPECTGLSHQDGAHEVAIRVEWHPERSMSASEQALLRTQSGPGAGVPLSVVRWHGLTVTFSVCCAAPPSSLAFTAFFSALPMWPSIRSVWPPSSSVHEDGGAGKTGVRSGKRRSSSLQGVEIVVDGLPFVWWRPVYSGHHSGGQPRRGARDNDGAALVRAIPNWSVVEHGLGWSCWRGEVAGRWSEETRAFIRLLARARNETTLIRRRAEQAWRMRWWAILSCAAARAFAASLLGLRFTQGADGVSPSSEEVMGDHRHAGLGWSRRSGCSFFDACVIDWLFFRILVPKKKNRSGVLVRRGYAVESAVAFVEKVTAALPPTWWFAIFTWPFQLQLMPGALRSLWMVLLCSEVLNRCRVVCPGHGSWWMVVSRKPVTSCVLLLGAGQVWTTILAQLEWNRLGGCGGGPSCYAQLLVLWFRLWWTKWGGVGWWWPSCGAWEEGFVWCFSHDHSGRRRRTGRCADALVVRVGPTHGSRGAMTSIRRSEDFQHACGSETRQTTRGIPEETLNDHHASRKIGVRELSSIMNGCRQEHFSSKRKFQAWHWISMSKSRVAQWSGSQRPRTWIESWEVVGKRKHHEIVNSMSWTLL